MVEPFKILLLRHGKEKLKTLMLPKKHLLPELEQMEKLNSENTKEVQEVLLVQNLLR